MANAYLTYVIYRFAVMPCYSLSDKTGAHSIPLSVEGTHSTGQALYLLSILAESRPGHNLDADVPRLHFQRFLDDEQV